MPDQVRAACRYLRRTCRDGARPRHETLANLSGLPERAVDPIEAALKGAALVPAGQAMTITRSCRTANVAACGWCRLIRAGVKDFRQLRWVPYGIMRRYRLRGPYTGKGA